MAQTEKIDCPLSKRELEVLFLIAHGYKSKQIADQLFIDYTTIRTHRQNMMNKTRTHNMAQLCSLAVKSEWIKFDPLLNLKEEK
ncbi:MAG: helix-turn-helix transcriptional regulator [Bacteroidetes bacterium]|nr:helix-turn-helix transcriptional regulator [Bacteroidota bacterium]